MGEPKPPQKAGEEHTTGENEHLAAIVRSSDDAILSKDRNARITSWNKGAERLYGYTAEEMIGESVALLIPKDREGEEREIIRRILAGERVEHYETWRVRKDGRTLPISLTASPIHSLDGEITGVSTQARDLTRTSEALQGAETRFQSAFHDAPIGMSVFSVAPDSFGRLEQCNPAMTRLLGYTLEEMREVRAGELTHPDDAALERPLLEALAAGKRESYGLEKRNRHKDGHWVWIWVSISLLKDEDPPCSAIAHVLDITERKQAEQELADARENLERSNTELDQFAYVASHDLKEPLILLSAYARLLGERYSDALDDEGRTFLGHVRDEAGRMKAMIDDLLDYSRLETRAEDASPVNLGACFEAANRTIAPRVEEAAGRIELEGELPTVQGSSSQFERLFRNLLSNAVKFHGEEPPLVRVSAAQEADEWEITVSDNGIGIDPAKAERVFEVFQRLHGQERYAGTGMGLAICKRIVERHGGRIWVDASPGGGSAFHFTLPR